ncbi:TAT-variant-translocated molybdopterin oxidoreductase [Psychroflexus sediminis]|uniref:Quinol:cytochrome c oxidoreductase iron-sulfur protein n=1 Tax=Psychroflexus sediminis TaxID=470826 RepID=A0A1G7UM58_9FLAO|nr:TAT-variant-translocated molybdopterin oxidoreductase [Psychroflexus sediminis]SDG48604.1 quinol:cytochrome c oxidoreductase iron-sulfur protein precursor [Psychroflexus sediminis]
MSSEKKYWKSAEQLKENSPLVEALEQKEFAEHIPADEFLGDKEKLEGSQTSRRDFLKYVGFSTAAASLAACEGPVIKSIPYVVQPERIVPGVADYYATTIANGFDFASVLVKTREGRPIKIEKNKEATGLSAGKARVYGSVLDLYDIKRLQNPQIENRDVTWTEFFASLESDLKAKADKKTYLLTQTFASPSTDKLIKEFQENYPNVVHLVYDTVSDEAAVDAFAAKYGYRALPNYDFSKSEMIVSVGADFLADWQGGAFDSGYSKSRVPKNGKMSRHVQFEANMTLTGANADKRVSVKPSLQKQIVVEVYNQIVGKVATTNLNSALKNQVDSVVSSLKSKASGGAVFVTGLDSVEAQAMALEINEKLSSRALDTENPRLIRQGQNSKIQTLISDMKAGNVGALMIAGANPAYSLPNADEFTAAMANVDTTVSFSMKKDETAKLCKYIAATPHYLESWGDVRFTKKDFSLMQPTIKPLFNTRQFEDCLLKLNGNSAKYYEYIKANFKSTYEGLSWNKSLHDGSYVFDMDLPKTSDVPAIDIPAGAKKLVSQSDSEGLELTLYTKVSMGDGSYANNPWLQEMPDPITRTSWDNYVTVSQSDAQALGLENSNVANGALNGDYVTVTLGDKKLEKLPVIIQPGQAPGSIGIALGYGKTEAIQEEMQVGVNAFPLYQNFDAHQTVRLEKVSGVHEFACVQLQHTMMGRRDIVKETTLEIFNTKDKHYWNATPEVSLNHQEVEVTSPEVDLWDEFDRSIGHHFNLSIDLNACTGCGACVIACHSENNVPVVGKSEIRKSRDMHWLRIDRYYSSEDTIQGDYELKNDISGLNSAIDTYGDLENASEGDLQVIFQPVMCQHCNHAPCETVCPVAASAHGRQGQNHMTYNRCVGTRYCANNCPYKVRRFNWFLYNQNDEFDYHMNNDLGRMVLNPDVTVRSRGVMEKCSMCIQMTQKTILDAKREGRVIEDGEFKTACSSACDNGAILFGDINDKESVVYKKTQDDRMYHLLEYLGTKPNVMYQTKVRNTTEA